ncbi:hypothetical protein Tco_0985663 [Tanacetum coccineum]
MKGKPLVLPWGRTPRLNSGVRWAEVGPLPGKDPLIIVSCGLGLSLRTSAYPAEASYGSFSSVLLTLDHSQLVLA